MKGAKPVYIGRGIGFSMEEAVAWAKTTHAAVMRMRRPRPVYAGKVIGGPMDGRELASSTMRVTVPIREATPRGHRPRFAEGEYYFHAGVWFWAGGDWPLLEARYLR